MKVIVIDNYDSFTYNLVYLIREITGVLPDVYRNDKIKVSDISIYDKILLSPGPGIPSEAGELLNIIKTYSPTKSILGVCLGHQAIGEVFGGTLINLSEVYHGVATEISILNREKIFSGLPDKIKAGRYHSWSIKKDSLPANVEITAIDTEGDIMALRHKKFDVQGVQFHPESVLTEYGKKIVQNWLSDSK
jgi:anthranilate synthase component II